MKRVYHLLAIFGYSFNKNKIKYKIKIYKGASKASDLNRINYRTPNNLTKGKSKLISI
jgi:hypothetical protein